MEYNWLHQGVPPSYCVWDRVIAFSDIWLGPHWPLMKEVRTACWEGQRKYWSGHFPILHNSLTLSIIPICNFDICGRAFVCTCWIQKTGKNKALFVGTQAFGLHTSTFGEVRARRYTCLLISVIVRFTRRVLEGVKCWYTPINISAWSEGLLFPTLNETFNAINISHPP